MTPVEAALIQKQPHVDFSIFGSVPLEIYIENKEWKYLDLGQFFSDRQWENPTPDGLTNETRFWIDDMYMITAVQVQAFRATGNAIFRIRRKRHRLPPNGSIESVPESVRRPNLTSSAGPLPIEN